MRLLPLLLCLQSVVAQTCYNSDHSPATDSIPCDPSGQSKHCCMKGSACLSNGLCFYGVDLGMNTGSCTDMTWTDPSCFSTCWRRTGALNKENVVFRCNWNTWCCGEGGNGTSCCANGVESMFNMPLRATIQNASMMMDGYTIAQTSDLITTSSNATSSNSTEASETSESCPTLANANSEPRTDNHKVMAVGVGVGVGVGLPLLAALAAALLLLRKERIARKHTETLVAQGYAAEKRPYALSPSDHSRPPPELDGTDNPGELDTVNELRSEVGGWNRRTKQ